MLDEITKANIQSILPEPFEEYIALVKDANLDLAFINSIIDLWLLEMDKIESLNDVRYTEDKWTVKEMLQYLGDMERIICAGLVRVARGETECSVDFNANEMVLHGGANKKSIGKIIEDLINVRKATHSLFRTFNIADLQKRSIHWIHPVSIVTMAYIIIGHQEHHLKSIRENYYPLVQKNNRR